MCNKDRGIDAQNGGAAVILKIESFEKLIHDVAFPDHGIKRLSLFEHNITDKSVAYHHVNLVAKQVVPLYIAHEIKVSGILHELVGSPGYQVTLFFLGTDIEKTHPWSGYIQDLLRIYFSKYGILVHNIGAGIGIKPDIEQQHGRPCRSWHGSGNAWPDYTRYRFDHLVGTHKHCTRVARAGKTVYLPLGKQFKAQHSTGIGFLRERPGRVFSHVDKFGGMNDVKNRGIEILATADRQNAVFVADQHQPGIRRKTSRGKYGTANGRFRGKVPSQDIKTDSHDQP